MTPDEDTYAPIIDLPDLEVTRELTELRLAILAEVRDATGITHDYLGRCVVGTYFEDGQLKQRVFSGAEFYRDIETPPSGDAEETE